MCAAQKKRVRGSSHTYRLHKRNVFTLLLDKCLKIDVNFDAHSLVIIFSFSAFSLYVLHACSSLLSLDFEFFNFVETRAFLRLTGAYSRTSTDVVFNFDTEVLLKAVAALARRAERRQPLLL